MELKKIENEILYLLSVDSSMNLAGMSKIMKKSKQVISYNINKLVKEGIIKRFFPIIDYTLLYSTWLRVLIRFSNTSPKKENEIIEFIKRRECVKSINKVDNYFDLIVEIAENNINEMYNLILSLEERYGKYILEDYFDIIMGQESFACRMFRNKRDSREILWKDKTERINLDEKDKRILREIEENSRVNYVSLSSKLKISPKTIINRVKRLEKLQIIKGYSIMIDWKKLGKVHYKILIDPFIYSEERFDSLKDSISSDRKVICIREVISRYMLEFDMIVDSYNEILELMNSLKENFSELIRGYDIVHVREEI